jgi:hypothetical protein
MLYSHMLTSAATYKGGGLPQCLFHKIEPTSQDAKPRVQPEIHPPFYLTNVEGEPRVKPGVLRPEMWALYSTKYCTGQISVHHRIHYHRNQTI